MKLLAAVSLIQMIYRWYRYLSKFLTKFYGISYYFSKILTEVALEANICKWFYWNLKALKHEYIFSKYSRNSNISEIFWTCYTKNNFPIIFLIFWRQSKFKILTFQIKPVWFETRHFLMRLRKIYWNWGISFVFKSKHT